MRLNNMLVHMRTSFDIPDELFRRAKKAAAGAGISLRELVVRALTAHLDRPKAGKYVFDWRVDNAPWNKDLPLHSREALEDYLGSWRKDLYG